MLAQRGLECRWVGVHRVADLAMGTGVRRYRIHRVLRPPRHHCQYDEAVPAIDLLGRREAGLAPIGIDRGSVTAATDLTACKHRADACGQAVSGQPIAHLNAAIAVDDGAE